MKQYRALLEERKDLWEKIKFKTEQGMFTIDELRSEIQKHKQICLSDPQKLSISFGSERELYGCLSSAYLRMEFALRVKIENSNTTIVVLEGVPERHADYEEIFPATFFLRPYQPSCPYLTRKGSSYRVACNANHRFAVWLLENGHRLNERAPGLFREMLRTLAEENGENLINNINKLLSFLHKLPGGSFDVPKSLYLEGKDLC